MCPAPTGGPTKHQDDVPTETWTAAASPHVLPYDLNVVGTLTIEPCAEVLLAEGITVTVSGAIHANGTVDQPIHIGAQEPAKPFVMIRTLGGSLRLSNVMIDGGGDPSNFRPNLTGTLNLQGTDQTKPSQETLFVDHVTIKGSKSNGLVLRDGAGFAKGSTDLTITGAALYPVSMWSRGVDRLPTGPYTGNGTDEILLADGGGYAGIAETATLHNRGVPYHVGDEDSNGILGIDPVGQGGPVTLTIEEGIELRFNKGGHFDIGTTPTGNPTTANVVAVGQKDKAKQITFTSAEAHPKAGDWLGIYFGGEPLPTNRIEWANVQFAGGESHSGSNSCIVGQNSRSDGAIRIFGGPGVQFVKHTTISDSAFFGIDRGWRKDDLTNFLPTNTFINVARCNQSYPTTGAGGCPKMPPCPTSP